MAATEHDSWTLFSSLDLQGEAEQIELAGFLDGLVQEFSRSPVSHSLKALHEDDDDEERGAAEHDAGASASYVSKNVQLSQGANIAVANSGPDLKNFPLPKGPVSPQTASEIVEVLRRGGALSMKAMKKLLRDVYKVLKLAPNVVSVNTQPRITKIHVVGDLHGQLSDLLHILDDAGMPSSENAYIFNGDFVDRGKKSVEVIAILFSLMLAWPQSVFLNRGNHEGEISLCPLMPMPSYEPPAFFIDHISKTKRSAPNLHLLMAVVVSAQK
jgi:serine/threonine-protein phosphatase with EF-hand domain